MNKAEKIEFVERFTGEIGSAPLIVVTEYRAVKVADSNSLRRRLEAKGLKLEVVKNAGSPVCCWDSQRGDRRSAHWDERRDHLR